MTNMLRFTLLILATITTLGFFGVSQAANVCNLENRPPVVDIGLLYTGGDFLCVATVFNPDNQEMLVEYSWVFTGTNLDESLFEGEQLVSVKHFFFTENAGIRCKATVTNLDQQTTNVISNKIVTKDLFKRVFGTGETVSGDFGGISYADEICQQEAKMYGAPGRYKAWISDNLISPAISFTKWEVPYINAQGYVFADNFSDITGESDIYGQPDLNSYSNPAQVLDPDYIFDYDFRGIAMEYIWTGTFWNGNNVGAFPGEPQASLLENCNNWTGGEAATGVVGKGRRNSQFELLEWTFFEPLSCGDTEAAFVCFEQ